MADTKEALVEFWKRHGAVLGAVPKPIYDELDALIRADERQAVLRPLLLKTKAWKNLMETDPECAKVLYDNLWELYQDG